jgi:hypothetical protein
MLHIVNGDSTAGTLAAAGLPGRVSVWADTLHEGPVAAVGDDAFLELRARYLADAGYVPYERGSRHLARAEAALGEAPQHDEVVMWFEHDLFDQLILIRLLDWFTRHPVGPTRLTLINIGAFPGMPDFAGLGQLSKPQLASLFPDRLAVTPEQLALGRSAWRVFCAPDPNALERLCATETSALPFLASALQRHLEEFPAVGTGLSGTERRILTALADGPCGTLALFKAVQQLEAAIFMGDWPFWRVVRGLASARYPLVRTDPTRGPDLPDQEAALTEIGRNVLEGRADHIHLNGIDRWLGGVLLHGSEVRWRWDETGACLRDHGDRYR